MATLSEIKELALQAAQRIAPANFSVENVDAALRDQFKAMCSSINEFKRNQYDIFSIIIETADKIVPQQLMNRMSAFAEIRIVPQGQKALFHKKEGRNRAKQFVTRVGLSGVYETWRLDTSEYEVPVFAVGSACSIDWERFLDGADNMADMMQVIVEGLEYAGYIEIARCLNQSLSDTKRPSANSVTVTTDDGGFDAAEMQKLVNTVKRYGNGATIFACDDFIDAMGPDAIVPAISGAAQGIYSQDDIDAIHNTGRIRIFRGTPIVELPQGFIDETNTKTWLNPQYAYVFPNGGEKVVKLVIEGETQMWLRDNEDQSSEIRYYKKMGAAIHNTNNWGIYKNENITDTSANPYGL